MNLDFNDYEYKLYPLPPNDTRKVIRLECDEKYCTAICDDGTLWVMNRTFGDWEQIPSII